MFGASSFINETGVFSDLQSTYANSHIIGCSTAGEIFAAEIHDRTLSVAVIRFENTSLNHCYFKIDNADDSYTAGLQITKALKQPGLKGIFVLSDGLLVNGSELIRGINQELQASVVNSCVGRRLVLGERVVRF